MQGGACSGDFFEDVGGFCSPDKGFWVSVVVVDVVADGGDQLLQVLEDAAPDLVCCQVTEEPFDHVEPGSRRRREADVESLVFQQPALDARMFVRRVVVADQVDFLPCRDCLIDHAQEAKPLLMAMDRKSTRLNSSHLGISYAVF